MVTQAHADTRHNSSEELGVRGIRGSGDGPVVAVAVADFKYVKLGESRGGRN